MMVEKNSHRARRNEGKIVLFKDRKNWWRNSLNLIKKEKGRGNTELKLDFTRTCTENKQSPYWSVSNRRKSAIMKEKPIGKVIHFFDKSKWQSSKFNKEIKEGQIGPFQGSAHRFQPGA